MKIPQQADDSSLQSEILRLCEERRDTLPAPPPQFEFEEEGTLLSSALDRGRESEERHSETIPAPPPSATQDAEIAPSPPTLPSWRRPTFDVI